MGELLPLSAEEVLTTTRAVRKRLDFARPVTREVIRECVTVALQAPAGSNVWSTRFVVVDEPGLRQELGVIYHRCYQRYRARGEYIGSIDKGDAPHNAQQQRSARSADFLADHLGEAPAIVLPCVLGRADHGPAHTALLGSVLPAMWSFMLAGRLRGLGTSWTSVHLFEEEAVAELLGIPADRVTQAALSPVAYTKGTSFRPALRPPADQVIHWNEW